MRQHFIRIHEDSVTTCRTLVRNTILIQQLRQILHLVNTRLEHIKLGVLLQTNCQSSHIATIHTTIGDKALVRDTVAFAPLVPVLAVGSDEATHIHDTVLLSRHRHTISIGEHLLGNLLNTLVGITLLAGLDEISILSKTSRVHIHRHAILMAQLTCLTDILHRYWLTSYRVIRHSQHHKWHIARVVLEELL